MLLRTTDDFRSGMCTYTVVGDSFASKVTAEISETQVWQVVVVFTELARQRSFIVIQLFLYTFILEENRISMPV